MATVAPFPQFVAFFHLPLNVLTSTKGALQITFD